MRLGSTTKPKRGGETKKKDKFKKAKRKKIFHNGKGNIECRSMQMSQIQS